MSNAPYRAPSVVLPNEIGKIIDLENFRPNPIVLFFYPRDNTSGCTKEAKDFTENLDLFDGAKVSVFGVSKDSIESHKKFKKKHNIKFDLLSDEEKKSIKAYKTWGKKKFMGREFMGQIRSSFVISKGKILNEWRNVRVKDHAQEILDFIKSFKKA